MTDSDLIKLIGGGFGGITASFAVHSSDKKKAKDYLKRAKKERLTVADAVRHATAHLSNAQGWPIDLQEQLELVRKFFSGKLPDK